jgi:ABC-type sugar transport system permease subunit
MLSRGAGPRRREGIAAAIFITPAATLILATVLVPILLTAWISLHRWSMLTPIAEMQWVGSANFEAIFRDRTFIRALANTVTYTVALLAIAIPAALLLAVFLQQAKVRGRNVVLGVLFTTYVIPSIAVALVWGYLFSPSGGPLNEILRAVGLGPLPWLGSPTTALWSIVIVMVWQVLGYFTTILVAGLTQISREYYEAAEIDGAGPWTKLRRITIPLLRRPLTFAAAICLIYGYQVFEPVYVLTQGGPSDSTVSVTYHAYRTAFSFGNAGRASAMSLVLLVAVLLSVAAILVAGRDTRDD